MWTEGKMFLVFFVLEQMHCIDTHRQLSLKNLGFCFGICVHMVPHLLKSVQVMHTYYCRILPPDKLNADLHFSCRLTCSDPMFQKWEGLVWQNTAPALLSCFLWATLGHPDCIPVGSLGHPVLGFLLLHSLVWMCLQLNNFIRRCADRWFFLVSPGWSNENVLNFLLPFPT